MALLLPLCLLVLHAAPVDKTPADRPAEERRLLVGERLLTLQWLDSAPGSATVSEKDGVLWLRGEQRDQKTGNYVTLEGQVLETRERLFVFKGSVETRVDYLAGGKPCRREGTFHFRRTGKRRYWRMKEMDNPCEAVVDYVDVYLKSPERK